jgi:hypothetical protein
MSCSWNLFSRPDSLPNDWNKMEPSQATALRNLYDPHTHTHTHTLKKLIWNSNSNANLSVIWIVSAGIALNCSNDWLESWIIPLILHESQDALSNFVSRTLQTLANSTNWIQQRNCLLIGNSTRESLDIQHVSLSKLVLSSLLKEVLHLRRTLSQTIQHIVQIETFS